ncbi:methyltransferase domain-containing protein [Granulicella sp. S156]|uniref:methyltransferase domain-containing protein n=1 Tax=Granulicella sp. S156 TaxID=1747224 RepID=UPI0020B14C88|nr:methyltransferase domain-containing protein [Granulicella sp. S156]
MAISLVEGKSGLEIGGPSAVFRERGSPLPIYKKVGSLDNCDISRSTVWASHSDSYAFSPQRPAGRNIFCDGSDLSTIANKSYDFILSCHNLEHFANPVKALKEWQRVTRPGGALVLVLPNYSRTFDHRRAPTPVSHMLQDYDQNIQEDDLTHLPEILLMHDLSMDRSAGTREAFRERSQKNFTNRCLHHHVFDEINSRELLIQAGMDVLAVETALPYHIFLLARMP